MGVPLDFRSEGGLGVNLGTARTLSTVLFGVEAQKTEEEAHLDSDPRLDHRAPCH